MSSTPLVYYKKQFIIGTPVSALNTPAVNSHSSDWQHVTSKSLSTMKAAVLDGQTGIRSLSEGGE